MRSWDPLFKSQISTSCLIALSSFSLLSNAFSKESSSELISEFDNLLSTHKFSKGFTEDSLKAVIKPNKEALLSIEVAQKSLTFPKLPSNKNFQSKKFPSKIFDIDLVSLENPQEDFDKQHLVFVRSELDKTALSTHYLFEKLKLESSLTKNFVTPRKEVVSLRFKDPKDFSHKPSLFQVSKVKHFNLKPQNLDLEFCLTDFAESKVAKAQLTEEKTSYLSNLFEDDLINRTNKLLEFSKVLDDQSFANSFTKPKPSETSIYQNVITQTSIQTFYQQTHQSSTFSDKAYPLAVASSFSSTPINASTPFYKHHSDLDEILSTYYTAQNLKTFVEDSTPLDLQDPEYEPFSSSTDLSLDYGILSPKTLPNKEMSFEGSKSPSYNLAHIAYSSENLNKGHIPLHPDQFLSFDLDFFQPKESVTHENALTKQNEHIVTLASHIPDLFEAFFTKTSDFSQLDLNACTNKTFYISKNALDYAFLAKDQIITSKLSHFVSENSLDFASKTFEDLDSYAVNSNVITEEEKDFSPVNNLVFNTDKISLSLKNFDLETPILEVKNSYRSLNKHLAFENNTQILEPILSLDQETPSYQKPITIYSNNLRLASNLLEQNFDCKKDIIPEQGIIQSFLQPLNESSKKFVSMQKLFGAKLNKYSVLLNLPPQYNIDEPKALVNITRVRSPNLVENKVQLVPTRFASGKLNNAVRHTNKNLDELPSLDELNTTTLSEEFLSEVQVTPYKDGKGYLFAVTIEPINNKLFERAPHNFLFLVDKSGSIQKPRYDAFRAAVSKSLKYLQEGDTFNIMTFDSKLTAFSQNSVYYTPSSKHAAKHFIETQPRSTKYALPNLYKLLIQAHEIAKKSELPTSVILLTNGKTLEDFSTNNDMLSYLVNANNDNFTLYATCASRNNNQVMLEVLSTLNKGEFMHSQTFAAFPRKVASIVKHAGNLLAHSIHLSAVKNSGYIEFFPDPKLTRNLFSDKPYTIIGYAEKLCDFELVLQGRLGHHWLNLKKEISLKQAERNGKTLHKELAMYQAYNKYYEFLKHGNTALLDEAQKLLNPYNLRSLY